MNHDERKKKKGGDKSQKRKSRKPKLPVVDARVLLIVFKGLEEEAAESIGMEKVLQEMFWIMSQFGKVQKLSNFLRDNKVQLLVQFAESCCADGAMEYLNCREYAQPVPDSDTPAIFKFAIVLSSVSQLTFKKQDEKNKDYEAQNALIEKEQLTSPLDFIWGENKGDGWLCPKQEESSKGTIPRSTGARLPKGEVGSCMYLSYAQDFKITAENLYRVCGQYGTVIAAKILQKHDGKAIVQYASKDEADIARKKLDGVTVGGKKFVAKQSHHPNALNWNGEQSENEPKLYSQLDDVPAEVVPEMAAPSRIVWLRNADGNIATSLTNSLTKQSLPLPIQSESDGTSSTFTFKSIEDAFLCIANFNGVQSEGFSQRNCMGFAYDPTQPVSPVKTAAKEKKPSKQRNSTDVPNRIEDFLKTCSFEPTEERDIKKKLRDHGYDLATDLYGVSNSKIETLGIKPGHANRMIQKAMAVYRMMHSDPYLDPYLALWGQPRSCTTPTNGNRTEPEWEGIQHGERTATAPIPNRQIIDAMQSFIAARVVTDPMQQMTTGLGDNMPFGYTRKVPSEEMPKRHETAPTRSQTIDDVDKLLPAERRERTAPVGPGPAIGFCEPRNLDSDPSSFIRHMTAPEHKDSDGVATLLENVSSDISWGRRCETTPNG